jgi:hypothetical protein
MIFGSPPIVTSGLVLNLDAGNTKSYPRSGTVWRDLSGNNNSGSLVNGPTFSSDNGGSIVFDGTDDYVQYGTGSGVTTDWTVSVWFYSTSVINYKNVIDCNYGYSSTIGNLGPRLEMNTAGNLGWVWSGDTSNGNNLYFSMAFTGSVSMQPNVWYNAVIARTSANTITNYINGELKTNTFTTFGTPSATFINRFNNIVIGKGFGAYNQTDRNLIGRVASVQIYNRALSAQEIQQNYNAQKSRFNLQ